MAPQNIEILELDAVIVGAGFSGIYVLHRLRDELHLNVKILEAGPPGAIGGVWYCNNYPGARVDMKSPYYSFGIDEVWKTWNWTELYASQKDMKAYFQHVDKVLSVSKDCIFNARVKAAEFDTEKARWSLQTEAGQTVVAKYFIPAIGGATKPYTPQWKGVDSFQGPMYHSSSWPSEGIDVRGKRAAVIGTGATGVQIIQEWGKEAGELFVFQRTPNISLPMRQEIYDSVNQEQVKNDTPIVYANYREKSVEHQCPRPTKKFIDQTVEEWDKALSDLYDEGGYTLWASTMTDLYTNLEGNRFVYDFWAKKTRERIHDPVKRDLLAPLEPPHPFAAKRPSMERGYFEQFNKPNIHVIDMNEDPIVEITPHAIVSKSGKFYEVDAVALATGYDVMTGALIDLGIRDTDGIDLGERWKNGVSCFLGFMVPKFPNLFVCFGPQTPITITNSPMLIEWQADCIRDLIQRMEGSDYKCMEPRPEAAQAWREETLAVAGVTIIAGTKSYYTGANIPGKPNEALFYLAGTGPYKEKCVDSLGVNFEKSFILY